MAASPEEKGSNVSTADDWPVALFQLVQQKQISQIANVPDAGLTRFLDLCRGDAARRVVTLSTEEEGIGLCLGAWLGGQRALLAMQSSGVGNCINALALPADTRTPCLMLVTMRGQEGEGNPWQVPMGRATRLVLEAMGVTCFEAEMAPAVGELFAKATDLAFGEGRAVAVLVAQKVIGVKRFEQ